MSWFVDIQVCLQINGDGGAAKDRASLHLEVEITENGISCREGIRGTFDEAGVLGFNDMMTDGERTEGKGTNQPPPEEVDEDGRGKRTRNMRSRNLSRGRKLNCQRLTNTDGNGR